MTLCALSPSEIAQCASRALFEELETFPKPGLVNFVDAGSHPDMDAECFLASIHAIEPGFERMAAAAVSAPRLADLQRIGLATEKDMFAATCGRNTHRGAIFCLGLLAAAAGCRHLDAEGTLGEIVSRRWGWEIPQAEELSPASAGISMCQRYRLGGVRREASLGFPTVYGHGVPAFRSAIPFGRPAARVAAFLRCSNTARIQPS